MILLDPPKIISSTGDFLDYSRLSLVVLVMFCTQRGSLDLHTSLASGRGTKSCCLLFAWFAKLHFFLRCLVLETSSMFDQTCIFHMPVSHIIRQIDLLSCPFQCSTSSSAVAAPLLSVPALSLFPYPDSSHPPPPRPAGGRHVRALRTLRRIRPASRAAGIPHPHAPRPPPHSPWPSPP